MTSSLGLVRENKLRHLSKDLNVRTQAAMQNRKKKIQAEEHLRQSKQLGQRPKGREELGKLRKLPVTSGHRREKEGARQVREERGQGDSLPCILSMMGSS